jgi:hypothetical protein
MSWWSPIVAHWVVITAWSKRQTTNLALLLIRQNVDDSILLTKRTSGKVPQLRFISEVGLILRREMRIWTKILHCVFRLTSSSRTIFCDEDLAGVLNFVEVDPIGFEGLKTIEHRLWAEPKLEIDLGFVLCELTLSEILRKIEDFEDPAGVSGELVRLVPELGQLGILLADDLELILRVIPTILLHWSTIEADRTTLPELVKLSPPGCTFIAKPAARIFEERLERQDINVILVLLFRADDKLSPLLSTDQHIDVMAMKFPVERVYGVWNRSWVNQRREW